MELKDLIPGAFIWSYLLSEMIVCMYVFIYLFYLFIYFVEKQVI